MGDRAAQNHVTIAVMLAIAVVVALLGPAASAGGDARLARGICPSGDIAITPHEAQADSAVRYVSSPAVADCVVRWARVAPGPGEWRIVSSWPDHRIYLTTGIADITVFIQ